MIEFVYGAPLQKVRLCFGDMRKKCTFAKESFSQNMDVAFLLKEYFNGSNGVSIDVFDAQSLNDVYKDVVNTLTSQFDIEVSVLQFLDNK